MVTGRLRIPSVHCMVFQVTTLFVMASVSSASGDWGSEFVSASNRSAGRLSWMSSADRLRPHGRKESPKSDVMVMRHETCALGRFLSWTMRGVLRKRT